MVQQTSTSQKPRILIGIPVYNEETYVGRVLEEVQHYSDDILVVDDGSTDRTSTLLAQHPVEVIRHTHNRGYGHSMQSMLRWARFEKFDWLITMDCDEQHEPAAIPRFIETIQRQDEMRSTGTTGADIISGSRYLKVDPRDDDPPQERRAINQTITDELNQRLGLDLTDGFCGFKAYRIEACNRLALDIDGYDFPMQFWVQAVAHGLKVVEKPVRLIYHDPDRSFGGPLDVAAIRLDHYRETLYREITRCQHQLPATALCCLQDQCVSAASECDR